MGNDLFRVRRTLCGGSYCGAAVVRHARAALYFLVGLLLGGWAVLASAQTTYWFSPADFPYSTAYNCSNAGGHKWRSDPPWTPAEGTIVSISVGAADGAAAPPGGITASYWIRNTCSSDPWQIDYTSNARVCGGLYMLPSAGGCPPPCPAGQVRKTDGTCGCPSGQELWNGTCVAVCPANFTRNQTTGQCVSNCQYGSNPDGSCKSFCDTHPYLNETGWSSVDTGGKTGFFLGGTGSTAPNSGCLEGCQATVEYSFAAYGTGNKWWGKVQKVTNSGGASCSGDFATEVPPNEQDCLAQGKGAVTVGGVTTCVTPATTTTNGTTTTTTTGPNGATTQTTQTTQTTTTAGGGTTIVQTTTGGGGTTTTTTEKTGADAATGSGGGGGGGGITKSDLSRGSPGGDFGTENTPSDNACEGKTTPECKGKGGNFGNHATDALYTAKQKTFETVLASFVTMAQASPIMTAADGFFDVPQASGGCPAFGGSVPFINADLSMPSDWCSWAAWDWVGAAMLLLASLVGFRWAFL